MTRINAEGADLRYRGFSHAILDAAYFSFRSVDAKREATVSGYAGAPGTLVVAGQENQSENKPFGRDSNSNRYWGSG